MYYHFSYFFFFNDTATTEIYTLSLHDALPILDLRDVRGKLDVQPLELMLNHHSNVVFFEDVEVPAENLIGDRKSTRLNSSHGYISYAVFCLKKKNHHYSMAVLQPQLSSAHTPI